MIAWKSENESHVSCLENLLLIVVLFLYLVCHSLKTWGTVDRATENPLYSRRSSSRTIDSY